MSTQTRREQEKENRRQAILDAAEKIMSEKGIHGLNMDMVAHETMLAKGTLYLYFKSKEEILAALTLKSRMMLLKEMQTVTEKHDSPIEQLKEIVFTNYYFHKNNSLYYDLVSLYEVNNTLVETPELQDASGRITEFVAGLFQKAQAEGSVNPDLNPYHLTATMWGMTIGILQIIKVRGVYLYENQNITEQDLLKNYVNVLENGIKK
jgi:TetR/AcrR family transcriptional regulator